MRKYILAILLCYHAVSAAAGEKPFLHFCTEDNDSWPWLLKDRVGVTTQHLKLVEKKLGLSMEITPLPWKRCMAELKSGNMDGAFKISYSAARAAEIGTYPMQGDKPDASKRLLTDSYSLYRLKGSNVSWDGKTLNANGPIGAQTGFSIVEQLKALGATVDEGGRAPGNHLQKLLLGRLAAVALQSDEGDMNIISNPEFRGKIEKVVPVLVEKPYFLIFSRQFYAHHPGYAQQVWDAIEVVRESAEYKKYLQSVRDSGPKP